MTWFRREVAVVPAPELVVVTTPVAKPKEAAKKSAPTIAHVPAVPPLDMSGLQEYAQVCAELGFVPTTLLHAKVLLFCAENNIEVYNWENVRTYMNKVYGGESEYSYASWGWWPMRERDIAIMPGRLRADGRCWAEVYNKEFGGGQARGVNSAYREEIPLPALLTAQKIAQGVPEILGFAVAAPCERMAKDPFLGVMVSPFLAPVIVERWNEPSFR